MAAAFHLIWILRASLKRTWEGPHQSVLGCQDAARATLSLSLSLYLSLPPYLSICLSIYLSSILLLYLSHAVSVSMPFSAFILGFVRVWGGGEGGLCVVYGGGGGKGVYVYVCMWPYMYACVCAHACACALVRRPCWGGGLCVPAPSSIFSSLLLSPPCSLILPCLFHLLTNTESRHQTTHKNKAEHGLNVVDKEVTRHRTGPFRGMRT